MLSAILLLFISDAIPVSINSKRIIVLVFVLMMSYNTGMIYFFRQDYQWNPFGNKIEYSQISFKSLLLSSYVNLIIFIGKPLFADVMRLIKKCKMNGDKDNGGDYNYSDDGDVRRCGAVYKQPFVKWNELDKINDTNYNHTNTTPSSLAMATMGSTSRS